MNPDQMRREKLSESHRESHFKKRKKIYTPLDDIKSWEWCEVDDVPRVIELWEVERASIIQIAEVFNRDPDEVFLLLFDLARKNRVKRKFY